MAAPVKKYQPMPEPTTNVESLRNVALALKENVEVLTLQRGDPYNAAVTWGDLVALGLINPLLVPKKGSSGTGA